MNDKQNFFKNHMDTLAIIGVNIAIAAILISMNLNNSARTDSTNANVQAVNAAANARIDTLHTMFYDLLKEVSK